METHHRSKKSFSFRSIRGITMIEVILSTVLMSTISLALGPLLAMGVSTYTMGTERVRAVHDVGHGIRKLEHALLSAMPGNITAIAADSITLLVQGQPIQYSFQPGAPGSLLRAGVVLIPGVESFTMSYYDGLHQSTTDPAAVRAVGIMIVKAAIGQPTFSMRTEIALRGIM